MFHVYSYFMRNKLVAIGVDNYLPVAALPEKKRKEYNYWFRKKMEALNKAALPIKILKRP